MFRPVVLSAVLVLGVSAQAQQNRNARPRPVVTTKQVFKGIKPGQPVCYGREYPKAHLEKKSAQKVEQIKIKLWTRSDSEGGYMNVEARLKNQQGINFHNEFVCQDENGKAYCYIECDGGKVKIAEASKEKFVIVNEGFVLRGGCGDEESTDEKIVMLESAPNGDDVFQLYPLPAAYCSDQGTN